MRLNIQLPFFGLFLFAITVLSAPTPSLQKRDNAYERACRDVIGSLSNLQSAFNRLPRDSNRRDISAEKAIDGAEKAVTDTMRRSAASMRSSPRLPDAAVASLLGAVTTLQQAVQAAVSSLIKVAPTIKRNGGREVFLQILADQDRAADEFTHAMADKMPNPIAQQAGYMFGTNVRRMIKDASNAFRK